MSTTTPPPSPPAASPPKDEPKAEAKAESSGGGGAIAAAAARAKEAAEAEETRQQELVEAQAKATEDHYEEWKNSSGAVVHKQLDEVERIMHGPSPAEAWVDHEGNVQTPGMVVGDPTKGPSS